jgi:hypothetical protein
MRVRDHIALSTGAAAVLYPRLRRAVVVPWAASILIDADHYLWFVVRYRRLSPAAAVRLFNQAGGPKHAATRPLHHPVTLLLLLLAGRRWPTAALPVAGLAFHAGLDAYHRARTADSQRVALIRDRFTCRVCRAQSPGVVAHLWRQPRLLPSYRVEHFVALCADCHEAAHARGSRAVASLAGDWESYRARVAMRSRATEAT